MFLKAIENNITNIGNLISKKDSSEIEYGTLNDLIGGYNLGRTQGINWLTAMAAVHYYNTISPIAKSVNLVGREYSTIETILINKAKGDVFRSHEALKGSVTRVLDKLNNPNPYTTKSLFLKQLANFYQICGNSYILIEALSPEAEPINLYILNPLNINPINGMDGIVKEYQYHMGSWNLSFKRDPAYRYLGMQNGLSYELCPISEFNPNSAASAQTGQSKLTSVYLEIEQFMQSNVHNLSILKRGARPSGILTVEHLSDGQYENVKTQLKSVYSGAENAGNVMIFQGAGEKDFKPLSISNKDMDFLELKKFCQNSIYNNLDIPVALISTDKMTFSNFHDAKYMLYDSNVLPMTNVLNEELTRHLLPRYKGTEGFELGYLEKEIPALQVRYMTVTQQKAALGVLTVDEIRALIDYEQAKDGGDLIPKTQQVNQPSNADVQTKGVVSNDEFRRILAKQGLTDYDINNYEDIYYAS